MVHGRKLQAPALQGLARPLNLFSHLPTLSYSLRPSSCTSRSPLRRYVAESELAFHPYGIVVDGRLGLYMFYIIATLAFTFYVEVLFN